MTLREIDAVATAIVLKIQAFMASFESNPWAATAWTVFMFFVVALGFYAYHETVGRKRWAELYGDQVIAVHKRAEAKRKREKAKGGKK